MTDKQTILVTGGGGFLGFAIVDMLVKKGHAVTSFSRGRYASLDDLGVTQIQGDLSSAEDVDQAVQGMDTVFHVAAKPGVWGSYEDYYNTNTLGTLNVVNACLKHKVHHLIHTSSPSVVFTAGDMEGADESVPYTKTFHTHYIKTKKLAEDIVLNAVREKGLKAIILRPHLIWGPRDNNLVPRVIKRHKRLVKVGKRNNLVDTIYIDNAAHAHVLAHEKLSQDPSLSGKVYFITQDEPIPMWDMINGILTAADLPPITRTLPHRVVWCIGALLEGIYTLFRLPGEPKMTRFVADELATVHWFDISAVKTDLGYAPLVSTEQGLKRLASWLKDNPVT
ncbi:MAG: NAD-dependent epimerase/dehydratase family protein [Proteobacteria bacterium]|nr:NAD-dependent epimerase/dehydratase family protein [Pseudomonadota bacterium]